MIEYLPHMACLFGGFIAGYGICAVLTWGKVADSEYVSDCLDDAFVAASKSHTRVTDALAAKSARIQTLTDIARSQQSIKSGRILDVLEG